MGTLNITKSDTIDASAERVWEIIDDEFLDVYKWVTDVGASGAHTQSLPVPEGASVAGRMCEVKGLGTIDERITRYDRENKTLAYSANAEKVPSFLSGLEIGYEISAVGADRSRVKLQMVGDATGLMGAVMGPVMKKKFSGNLDQLMIDLKAYAETGEVSASKKKAIAKLARKN